MPTVHIYKNKNNIGYITVKFKLYNGNRNCLTYEADLK